MNSADLCARTGVTYRQLDHWARKGYLGATAQDTHGSGNARDWTLPEAAKVERMALLVRAGMSPASAAHWAHTDPAGERSIRAGRLVLAIAFREAS